MDCQDIERVSDQVRQIVLEGYDGEPEPETFAPKELWQHVASCGSELWLDTGDIEASKPIWCREFRAFTTNNTLLNKEVAKGTYDELIADTTDQLQGQVPEEDLPLEVTFVLNARHALKLVHKFGAHVSVELHTDLVDDVERSVAYGKRYYEICPEYFYVKVPFTPSGLLAARRLRQEGIPVNCTLGFAARQNYLIAAVAEPAFCNVFLGRLNSFVADNNLGSGEMVGERTAIASQQNVEELRREMGLKTRQIAASMRDGSQVLRLAGIDVLTMPVNVATEFEELNPEADEITPRTGKLPDVDFAPDTDVQEAGIDKLWTVPDAFKRAVMDLKEWNLDNFTADDVREFFGDRGFEGFLPAWSDEDRQTARENGKIPDYDIWKESMAEARADLDALMNLHAIYYFAADQKEMDERVKSML